MAEEGMRGAARVRGQGARLLDAARLGGVNWRGFPGASGGRGYGLEEGRGQVRGLRGVTEVSGEGPTPVWSTGTPA